MPRIDGDFTTLITFVAGIAATLITQWFGHRAQRDHERRRDQKEIAAALLRDVESYCSKIRARTSVFENRGRIVSQGTLSNRRDRIDARSVALTEPLARAHMASISTALWWLNYPADAEHRNPYPVAEAARVLLGAIQRSEPVPKALPMIDAMVNHANAWDAQIENQIAAQDAYEAEVRSGTRPPD